MDQAEFLTDCVITIASDDYESFELISGQTKGLAAKRGMAIGTGEVAEALKGAIDGGYLNAYVLSPQPPHATKVDYAPDRLHELWFYATPRGKDAAKSIPQFSGEPQ